MVLVDLLRAPLTPDQIKLLELVADVYMRERVWPAWPYVWSRLGIGALGAEHALRSLPQLGRRSGIYGRQYGLAWAEPEIYGIVGVPDSTSIGLTMAGLSRAGEQALVDEFLAVLAVCVSAYEAYLPGPNDTARPSVTSNDVIGARALPGAVTSVGDMVTWRPREPPFWRGSLAEPNEGPAWVLDMSDRIAGFRDIRSIDGYMGAVVADLKRDEQENASLFAAIDPEGAAHPPRWRRMSKRAASNVVGALGLAAATVFHDQLVRVFAAAVTWGEHLIRP